MRASLPRFRTKPAEPVRPGICLNCGAHVESKYCSECSQENEPLRLGIGHIFVDALEEFIKFDSKLFNTLRPLFFKPGFLTQEWARGRRVGYISPFKLYLTSTFLFFLVAAWNVDRGQAIDLKTNVKVKGGTNPSPTGNKETPEDAVEAYMNRISAKIDHADKEDIAMAVFDKLPMALFIFLPVFAAGLKLFYIRSGRYYVEHLVFSLHNHAFYFLTLTATSLFPWGGDTIGFLVCVVYSVIAMKRFYGQRWPKTLFKTSVLGCGYLILLSITLLGALFAGLTAMPDTAATASEPEMQAKAGVPGKGLTEGRPATSAQKP